MLETFKKHEVVPTIYICTQIVDTLRHFWFRVAGRGVEALKRMSNDDRLAMLESEFGFTPERSYPPEERQALSGDEIAAMKEHVDFGVHTLFHPILTTCSDEESALEIKQSKHEAETLLGRPCAHFSYPNGDYGERELELVRAAGYESGRTVDIGWNDAASDPLRLRILGMPETASLNMLAAHLSGIGYLRSLLSGRVDGKHRTILAPGARR